MNVLTGRMNEKPEHPPCSGFLVFLLFLHASAAAGGLPVRLFTELLRDTAAMFTLPIARADSAGRSTAVFASARYDDIYRRKVTDTGTPATTRETAALASSRCEAGLLIERERWGVRALARYARIDGAWDDRDETYRIDGSSPLHELALTGWSRCGRGRLLIGLGYDPGLPFDYYRSPAISAGDRIKRALDDPRFSHIVSATLSHGNFSLALYETKRPLLAASTRIVKRSNQSFVEIPCAASDFEAGGTAGFLFGETFFGATGAFAEISSDTALSGKNVLPAQIAGKGYRCGGKAAFSGIALDPAATLDVTAMRFRARGYDHGASKTFCRLDDNTLLFAEASIFVELPLKVRAGLLAERFRCGSAAFGKFEPYFVSEFSIFDPVQYRIDTFAIRHDAAGISLERSFAIRRGDSAGAALTVSYIRSSGSLDTREYDFSYLIPYLTNPKAWRLFGEKIILVAPEVSYALSWRRCLFTAALRQLVPIDISGKGHHGGAPDPSVTRSTHGGTTISLRADYLL